MSVGDAPTQDQLIINYDQDDSSSSKSIFNRSSFQRVSPQPNDTQCDPILSEQISSVVKTKTYEHLYNTNSQVRLLEDKINHQQYEINNQQCEIANLHKIIHDLSNQFHELKSVVNSPIHSPVSHSRPSSIQNDIHNDNIHQHRNICSSTSPTHLLRPHENYISSPAKMNSFHHNDILAGAERINYLQEVLFKTKVALEHREAEIKNLKTQNNELLHLQSISGKTSPNIQASSTHMTPLPSQISQTSAFTPVVNSFKHRPITLPTNISPSSSIMPFTMSLTNTLPSFGGKANEMPSKFITEFELRASGLFGYNDDYLIRAVQQVLSDTALTWFVQQQQELPITTWSQFKQLFLQRFRTPDKIELLRSRLRILWQGDTEPTADYFEKLKSLISEIEPVNSIEYLKRKFLQKLRKDIREKMTLGLTSSLSELVQKAIEIETNIIQQKIDDKLRDVHKEDNINKQKLTTINHLRNASQSTPSSLTTYNEQASHNNNYNNYNNNSKYNDNQPTHLSTKNSRTFTNSTRSPHQVIQIENEPQIRRQGFDRNRKLNSRNTNRWCSFCSSTSHSWFHCYSNPNGPKYQGERSRNVQQQSHQPSTISSNYVQEQNPTQKKKLNQPEFINHERLQQPYSSSYPSPQPFPMSENIQGSRY